TRPDPAIHHTVGRRRQPLRSGDDRPVPFSGQHDPASLHGLEYCVAQAAGASAAGLRAGDLGVRDAAHVGKCRDPARRPAGGDRAFYGGEALRPRTSSHVGGHTTVHGAICSYRIAAGQLDHTSFSMNSARATSLSVTPCTSCEVMVTLTRL